MEPHLPDGVADAVIEYMADMVLVVDSLGRIAYVNHTAELLLGWSRIDWIGRSAFDLIHPDDVGSVAESLATASASGPGIKQPIELRIRTSSDEWCPVEIISSNMLEEPSVRGLVVVARDLTARAAGLAVAEAERRRFEQVFDRSPFGMALVDDDLRFVRLNAALAHLCGRTQVDLAGTPVVDLVVPDDRDRFDEFTSLALDGAEQEAVEVRIVDDADVTRWVRTSLSRIEADDGSFIHLVLQCEDVTEEHILREQLLYSATHDDLTGLLNRPGFQSVFQHVAARERGHGGPSAALLFIDLDGFKQVNDVHGHESGDLLLELVAGRIRRTVRTSDAVARIGGDEFLVLLDPVVSAAVASDLAERIRAAIHQPVELPTAIVNISASIGVSVARGVDDMSDGLNRADAAAYAVKREGGNGVLVVDAS
ncbi:MAG: diguanylate cyclase domain-containing protein [Microthrixaceae bacterium]